MKLVYFLPSIKNSGGIERVLAVKSKYMVEELGYDITIVTYEQFDNPSFFEFSPLIKFIHLDIVFEKEGLSTGLIRYFISKRKFQKKYKKSIKSILFEIKYDFAISLGIGEEKYFLHKIKDDSKKILEFHFSYYYYYRNTEKGFLLKRLAILCYLKYLTSIFGSYKYFITLTNEDANEWRRTNNNVITIFNPITVDCNQVSTLESKIAVSLGRLVSDKGFDRMIDAWQLVNERHVDWKLYIYGSGELKDSLQEKISSLKLQDVIELRDSVSDVGSVYSSSSIYLLSSSNEGLPLALMESMRFGLPSVTFDCKYGPSELIVNESNGFLIKQGDLEGFAKAICKLIESKSLRETIGKEASKRSEKYTLDNIMSEWDVLFKKG